MRLDMGLALEATPEAMKALALALATTLGTATRPAFSMQQ